MKKNNLLNKRLDEHMGCFGSFDIEDTICKSLCALRISCCIERDHAERMEILEDLVESEDFMTRYH